MKQTFIDGLLSSLIASVKKIPKRSDADNFSDCKNNPPLILLCHCSLFIFFSRNVKQKKYRCITSFLDIQLPTVNVIFFYFRINYSFVSEASKSLTSIIYTATESRMTDLICICHFSAL